MPRTPTLRLLLVAVAGVLALAGCGGSDETASGPESAAESPAATTVALRTIDSIGETLVDAAGRTLYMTDQDTSTTFACGNQACTSQWRPLTVSAGQQPTGPDKISGKLSTVRRPDGSMQVAFDGKPLYTFSMDKGPGETTGNGVTDSFGGPELTWHALTPDGAAPTGAKTSGDSDGY